MPLVPSPTDAATPEAARLRLQILEAQAGCRDSFRAVLEWVATRIRAAHPGGDAAAEDRVQAALLLLNRLRHTYQPDRCPIRWLDAIIGFAAGDVRQAHRTGRAPLPALHRSIFKPGGDARRPGT
jgi:hypothetical protein